MRKAMALLAVVALLGALAARAGAEEIDKSDNVTLEARFPYTLSDADRNNPFFKAGTDIDFSGNYIYAMQQGAAMGGIHIFKATKKAVKEISFFPCGGEQNDIAVVKPGLVALGYHDSMCVPGEGSQAHGLALVDVRDPKAPKVLGSVEFNGGASTSAESEGAHTITVYPGTDYIYASPGGLAYNGRGVSHIIDVSNPAKPEVAATFSPNPAGCHDFTFHITDESKLGFCPGTPGTTIYDVTDPLAPDAIGTIVLPFLQLPHSVYVTSDGAYLALTDEAWVAADCFGGPIGNVWLYDITSPSTPVLVSTYDIERGSPVGTTQANSDHTGRDQWCSAHSGGFIPGTYQLVLSWYASGFNVIDYAEPASPTEIAYFDSDEANYWSAYWHKGRIYANDRQFAKLDVFKVDGLAEGKVPTSF